MAIITRNVTSLGPLSIQTDGDQNDPSVVRSQNKLVQILTATVTSARIKSQVSAAMPAKADAGGAGLLLTHSSGSQTRSWPDACPKALNHSNPQMMILMFKTIRMRTGLLPKVISFSTDAMTFTRTIAVKTAFLANGLHRSMTQKEEVLTMQNVAARLKRP